MTVDFPALDMLMKVNFTGFEIKTFKIDPHGKTHIEVDLVEENRQK